MKIQKLDIKNAVSVDTDQFYYVVHYDTIILKMDKKTGNVLKLLPVSDSSTRAIINGLEKKGFSYSDARDLIDLNCEELNGIPKNELVKMWKFKRYSQPERRTKYKLEETVQRLIGAEI